MVTEHVKNILENMKKFEKNTSSCGLCSAKLSIVTDEDIFKAYGMMLSCVSYHVLEISTVPFADLFILENYINGIIMNTVDYSVEVTLSNNGENETRERKRDDLLRIAQSCFSERKMDMYCEQDLESLFHKFYRRAERKFTNLDEYTMLLFILFTRKETERFFPGVQSADGKKCACAQISPIIYVRTRMFS